jgi:iron complex outermembrane recepter protein
MNPREANKRSMRKRYTGTMRSRVERPLQLLAICCGTLGSPAVLRAAESTAATVPPADSSSVALQEITVTATRRSETLQDVPYNISSIGASELAQAGITSINNLNQVVPGLQYVDTGPNPSGGNNQLTMRGLRTDSPGNQLDSYRSGTVAPVSTYLGETPIFFPLALKDLERVEVLKGPQGTLYGSGSLSGTIRFIPKRPKFDKFGGELNVEGSGTQYSSKPSWAFHGAVNVPLLDNLAVRVASGYERLGGFIDQVDLIQRSVPGDLGSAPALRVPSDPYSGYALAPIQRDTNWSENWFVRPTIRWKASDAVDAELMYMHQRVAVGDSQSVNPNYPGGTYSFNSLGNDPNSVITYRPGGQYKSTTDTLQPAQTNTDLASLVITFDFGAASLTSSSSVYRTELYEKTYYTDATQVFNADGTLAINYYDYYNNYPRANTQVDVQQQDQAAIQEVRLVSTWKKPIDYIVGLYYQAQHFNFESRTTEPGYTDYLNTINGPGLPRPNGDLQYYFPMSQNGFRFRDEAIFGELTWHILPQWQVTGGARVFRQDFTNNGYVLDYYFDGAGTVDLGVNNNNRVNAHILKFNTSYDFTPDLKLYATYSEGFRRGGANAIPLAGAYASVPQLINYAPDKSKNYEIGLKGTLFERAIRYTLDGFYVTLDNFQFNSYTGSAFPAVFSGTEAKSKGAEAEVEYQITRNLEVGLSYAYTDAKVANGFTIYDYPPLALTSSPPNTALIPAVTIASGSRLPGTSKSSASAHADYTIPLGTASVKLHGDVAYRSSAPGYIDPTAPYYWVIPSWVTMSARVTYDSGQMWSADFFVNNLTDRTVYSGGYGPLQTQPSLFQERYVGRPRTFGLGLHCKF